MVIKPYRQSLTHSCLTVCILMLLQAKVGISFDEEDEQRLALLGSSRKYPFYVVGIPWEIVRKYGMFLNVIADNKYFTAILQDAFKKQRKIAVMHESITLSLLERLLARQSLICHIDTNALGDYSHASHFIVLEKISGNSVQVIDPWSGKRMKIKKTTLIKGILSLKTHVKMSPLLFFLKDT